MTLVELDKPRSGAVSPHGQAVRRDRVANDPQFLATLHRTAMESSPDGILLVDAEARIISFNRRFVEMWNLPRDVVEAGDDGPVLATVTSRLKDPKKFLDRVRYLYDHPDEKGHDELEFADGRVFDRDTAALRDPEQRYLGRIWFFRDITERKRAQETLRQQRDTIQRYLDVAGVMILALRPDGTVSLINRMGCEVLGYDEAEILGRHWIDRFVPVRIRPEIQTVFQRLVAGDAGAAEYFENPILAKDGKERLIMWHNAVIRDDKGRCVMTLSSGQDVTEMRLVEARLRESEEQFRTIFKSVNDGIFVSEPRTGKFVEVNQSGCGMFGYTHEEIVGQRIEFLSSGVYPYTQDVALESMQKVQPGESQTIEWHCKAKDGHLFWAEISSRNAVLGGRNVVLSVVRDITERKRAEQKIRTLARQDVLTGLANRAVFVEAIHHAIAWAEREKTGFAVLYLDLDHFKDVNDTLGHPVGDLLLQAVAQRLQGNIRGIDTVARFGGDEFAVLAAGMKDSIDAGLLAEKLLKVVAEPYSIEGNEIRVGTSIGIAVYGPDNRDPETILSHADLALYRAKSEGRRTYRFFTEAMDSEVHSRMTLGADLRRALAQGELFLEYQPQARLEDGGIVGVEALVRWRHPGLGLLSPRDFIPAAERGGVIIALGEWTLGAACRQAKEWLDAGLDLPFVGVNVSAIQFKSAVALEAGMRRILAETGLAPGRLEVELTETALMEASREHGAVLRRLQESGVRLALDDFGTGYSSLGYLRRFPVNRIKIAQDFVGDLAGNPGNAAIVKAAIGLARELGIEVMAEGVETGEQAALLAGWGCSEAQGFHFAPPMGADAMANLLRQGRIVR